MFFFYILLFMCLLHIISWHVMSFSITCFKSVTDRSFLGCSLSVPGGMVGSQHYSMKLPTLIKRVCQESAPGDLILFICKCGDSLLCLPVPKWLSVSSGCILALLQWVSSFHSSLFPHLTVSCPCFF